MRFPAFGALACVLMALLPVSGHAAKVTVASVGELHAALQNEAVSHIDIVSGATGAAWYFREEEWPSQVVVERAVTMAGVAGRNGEPPYLDMNRLTELVVVRGMGSLLQSNLQADDCLVPVMPLLCFAVGTGDGRMTIQGGMLGDATCTDIQHSAAMDWLLKSAYWATWKTSWVKQDQRTILVEDTGQVAGMPHGMRWRLVNTTLRCTGNETHPLPGPGGAPASSRPSDTQLTLAATATLLAVVALVHYALNRNVVYVHSADSAEVVVARSKGIVLQALIGQGTFGCVYRGQYRGEMVAVKVIDFPAYERRAAAAVAKECAHAKACRHSAIVRCLTHFTVTVRTQLRRTALARGTRDAQLAYAHEQLLQARPQGGRGGLRGAARAWLQRHVAAKQPTGAAAAVPFTAPDGRALNAADLRRRHPASGADAGASAAACSDGGGPGSGGSEASSSTSSEGVMALLVLEYCPLGNLHRAIAADRFFADRRTQQPNLDWVCRTARDVAEGLAHLHDARSMVHRDVSTNNVLLVPDGADPRGFRAKLSDFGLSTVLLERRTHRTSQLKGTVDFMPPEIFTCGEIRFAVDIYGLGIMVYWMCRGEGPYTGLCPFQVVGRKLEEVHRKQRLLLPPTMPQQLRQLVWDCCHWDPRERPSASKVANELTDIILQLAEERYRRHLQS